MDGNNSLKRVKRKTEIEDDAPAEASKAGRITERNDPHEGGGDYFLSCDKVDHWAEDHWADILVFVPKSSFKQWVWANGRCEEKWFNGNDSNTHRMWAKFCETGIFLLICCHGLVLLLCDMVKSREQSKYPLAVLHQFLDTTKTQCEWAGQTGTPKGRLVFCYDIGCRLEKTIACSPLLGLAQHMGLQAAVGTMHGYAHERACQLNYLLLYMSGAGLEDGETCERYFSKSNELASSTHHASVFHCRQIISEYAYHTDNFETYGNLTLNILNTIPTLRSHLLEAGISDPSVFYQWLVEEGEYLQNLSREPPEETLKMQYYRTLVALGKCRNTLKVAKESWLAYVLGEHDRTNILECAVRHSCENEQKLIRDAQVLEEKLDIQICWMEGCAEWKETKGLLSRLNVSGTGYKMCKHLANALKTQSKAIQNAVTEYNAIASSMTPPRREISWDEVVEYTFLSEFNILWDTREDVRTKNWATPANCILMSQFYKVIQAEEELRSLHQQIQHLVTYMKTETEELISKEQELASAAPTLALQVRRYQLERGRFNAIHRKRLLAIRRLAGFNSANNRYFFPSTSLECSVQIEVDERPDGHELGWDDDDDEDEDDEDNENVNQEADDVLSVAID
ncbi:hypothetical protein GYMLUDRAFT_238956 [Collybiopsis luxurians FD-317 M1]|nr:hypothetical protein GYMLUDRAFT_238956 [Collybiopsis luxurians FD-317 M1]